MESFWLHEEKTADAIGELCEQCVDKVQAWNVWRNLWTKVVQLTSA